MTRIFTISELHRITRFSRSVINYYVYKAKFTPIIDLNSIKYQTDMSDSEIIEAFNKIKKEAYRKSNKGKNKKSI